MWTDTTRALHVRTRLTLPSDVADAEWTVLEPLLPSASPMGRPRKWPIRRILEAIVYLLRGGMSWRMLRKRCCCITFRAWSSAPMSGAREGLPASSMTAASRSTPTWSTAVSAQPPSTGRMRASPAPTAAASTGRRLHRSTRPASSTVSTPTPTSPTSSPASSSATPKNKLDELLPWAYDPAPLTAVA